MQLDVEVSPPAYRMNLRLTFDLSELWPMEPLSSRSPHMNFGYVTYIQTDRQTESDA